MNQAIQKPLIWLNLTHHAFINAVGEQSVSENVAKIGKRLSKEQKQEIDLEKGANPLKQVHCTLFNYPYSVIQIADNRHNASSQTNF